MSRDRLVLLLVLLLQVVSLVLLLQVVPLVLLLQVVPLVLLLVVLLLVQLVLVLTAAPRLSRTLRGSSVCTAHARAALGAPRMLFQAV